MERTKWVDRKFTFDAPEGWIYNILERLKGTSARIREMTVGLPDEKTIQKLNGKWSIKEHLGHLYDLEGLHIGRIDDFIEGNENLRAWDVTNSLTNESNHNDRSINELLEMFLMRRKTFISKLESLDDQAQTRKALHPRLKVMMRPVDVAFFVAEHDDHHLASIREILAPGRSE